jgi:hypothetical protein
MTEKQFGGSGIGAQVFMAVLAVLTGAVAVLFGSAAFSGRTTQWAPLWGSLAFGLIAAIFVVGFFLAGTVRRDQEKIAERQAACPDRPWLWSDEWREGRLQSWESRRGSIGFLVVALIWDAATIGGASAVGARDAWDPGTILWAVLFSAAGLFLTGLSIYQLLQRWKYSGSVFRLESVPGVLGGRLKGTVQMPDQVLPEAKATVSILCERTSRGGRSTTTWKLWEDRTHLIVPASRSIPVDFRIPYDLPPSDAPGSSPTSPIRWHVTVAARMPGVDYRTSFHDVPVFATDASDPSIVKGAIDASAVTERPPDAKTNIVESSAERTVFSMPPAKGLGWGLAIFLLLPVIVWLVAGRVTTNQLEALLAAAVAVLVGAGILALTCAGVAYTPTAIEIEAGLVRVPHGAWPFRWTRAIPVADIVEIKYTTSQATAWVDAKTAGKSYSISRNLPDVAEAKWLAAEVSRAVERHRGHAAQGPGQQAV